MKWAITILVAGLASLPSVADAQRTLVIEEFHSDIVVDPDGSILVTETIRPRFTGSWNGIFRNIPVDYRTDQGFNWKLRLSAIGATDGGRHALENLGTRGATLLGHLEGRLLRRRF